MLSTQAPIQSPEVLSQRLRGVLKIVQMMSAGIVPSDDVARCAEEALRNAKRCLEGVQVEIAEAALRWAGQGVSPSQQCCLQAADQIRVPIHRLREYMAQIDQSSGDAEDDVDADHQGQREAERMH